MARDWLKAKQRRMVQSGYETVRGSSRELAAMLNVGRPARKPPMSKDELRALIDSIDTSGVKIRRIPSRRP